MLANKCRSDRISKSAFYIPLYNNKRNIDNHWKLRPLGKKLLEEDSQKVSGFHHTVHFNCKGTKVHFQCRELMDSQYNHSIKPSIINIGTNQHSGPDDMIHQEVHNIVKKQNKLATKIMGAYSRLKETKRTLQPKCNPH